MLSSKASEFLPVKDQMFQILHNICHKRSQNILRHMITEAGSNICAKAHLIFQSCLTLLSKYCAFILAMSYASRKPFVIFKLRQVEIHLCFHICDKCVDLIRPLLYQAIL